MVTNECVRFNYDRLRADKALGNFRKPNNNNKKNNVRSAWDPFRVQKKIRKMDTEGAFACVGWQVTLCDPKWQVTSCSCEMGLVS